ncbi:transcription intermediary factor 1-alpha-like [Antedon mediterranea]|uniref:transcription intermediary factor 1-alpha-like n=1 Tax=Antedon mediterranea TaxID=105859 RepID=UPI003AF91350
MASDRSDEYMRLIVCQLCKDVYNVPKLLNCLHSFCEQCLPLTDTNEVICNICNLSTPVPDGTGKLKTNNFLLKLSGKIASFSKSILSDNPIVCTSCDNEEAFFCCNECDDFFCDDCRHAHSKVRLTRSHFIFSVSDIKNGLFDIRHVARTLLEECPRHTGEEIRFFCKTCGYLICRDCLLCDNHLKGDHECISVRDVVSSSKKELDKALATVHQKKKELVTASEAIESLLDDIESAVSEEESRVNLSAIQRIRTIEEEREQKLKFIRSKKNDNVKDLSTILEQIDIGLRNITDITSFSSNLVDFGQATDILVFKNRVITHANTIASVVSVPTIPSYVNNITVPEVKQESFEKIDKATQITSIVEAKVIGEVQSIGTSTDDLEVICEFEENTKNETPDTNGDDEDDEVTIIEDNMCDTIRQFVFDIITKTFIEHKEYSADVISSIKRVLENKFGPFWHIFTGKAFAWNIAPLNLDYAVLEAGDQRVTVFCSGSVNVPRQTLDQKAIIVETDMAETMKRDVVRFSKQAMSRYPNRSDIAKNVADVFRRKYGGKWQCFVLGKGSMVGFSKLLTATNSCIYITIGPEVVLLLKLSSR